MCERWINKKFMMIDFLWRQETNVTPRDAVFINVTCYSIYKTADGRNYQAATNWLCPWDLQQITVPFHRCGSTKEWFLQKKSLEPIYDVSKMHIRQQAIYQKESNTLSPHCKISLMLFNHHHCRYTVSSLWGLKWPRVSVHHHHNIYYIHCFDQYNTAVHKYWASIL
jgi:hypothetical protein